MFAPNGEWSHYQIILDIAVACVGLVSLLGLLCFVGYLLLRKTHI